jgi:hypothetical protein
MKIDHGFGTVKGIGGPIPIVEIEIEDESAFNLPVADQLFNGDGDIIEIAETPAGMGLAWCPGGRIRPKAGLPPKANPADRMAPPAARVPTS